MRWRRPCRGTTSERGAPGSDLTPPRGDKPRVLAIAEDPHGLVTACRVHAPLMTLMRLRLIDDYWVTDASMANVPPDAPFDVVWLQRARDRDLTLRLIGRLDGQFLLDMDDLLVARPSYIEEGDFPQADHIRAAVRACAVLTAPSLRLAGLLAERGCGDAPSKTVVCPNALEFPRQPPAEPTTPRGILLTQSHRLALTASKEAVLSAICDFAHENVLPVYYFGPPLSTLGAGVADSLASVVSCGYLDFWRYHALLAAWPAMIGAAPLETRGDAETLAFVAAKSDIKMVEYAGYGHTGVYSDAAPFTDTDLVVGTVVSNSYESWVSGLQTALNDAWRMCAAQQAHVVDTRSMESVAADCWQPAIRRARLPRPLRARELMSTRLTARGVLARARRVVGGS